MKRMIIFIGLVSIIIEISAQVSNYDKTKTFHEEGYTYQCDVIDKAKFVRLYNKENKFTYADQINKSTGKALTIILYINPDDGKIAEVEYQFVSFGPYATIPVSVYHNIEAELKKNIWFTPTKEGAKYNYIFLGWRHEVK